MNWEAFWLTVRLAVVVSALLMAIGIPIAYWLTYSRWRWKFLPEAVVALPIVLPPTVLGFYVLIVLGSRSPIGRWWESMTGHPLAFTFEGLVIGIPGVQPAFRGATVRGCILIGRHQIAARLSLARPIAAANLSPGRAASLKSRTGHRICPELRAHAWRVRGGADGRRKYSRRHPHHLDRHLRPGAGGQLCFRQCHGARAAHYFLPRAVGRVWSEPAALGCGAVEVNDPRRSRRSLSKERVPISKSAYASAFPTPKNLLT